MFENVRIKSGIDKESGDCNIYLSWRWVFDNNYEKPKCNIFCFGVEQEALLSNYIFREQDIISWFKEKYVDPARGTNFYDDYLKTYQDLLQKESGWLAENIDVLVATKEGFNAWLETYNGDFCCASRGVVL